MCIYQLLRQTFKVLFPYTQHTKMLGLKLPGLGTVILNISALQEGATLKQLPWKIR